jgi:hypothetical protein
MRDEKRNESNEIKGNSVSYQIIFQFDHDRN